MKKLLAVMLLLSASSVLAQDSLRFQGAQIHVRQTDANGVPAFVTGDLGRLLGPGTVENTARAFLRNRTDILPIQNEDFAALRTERDALGQTHVKLQERYNNLPVVGAEYIVHADREGRVIAMNGRFTPTSDLPRVPKMDAWSAIERAVEQRGVVNGTYFDKPQLTYVVNEKGNAFMAWSARVAYTNEQGPQVDLVYADTTSGDLVYVSPEYKYAKNRQTYTANNGTALPGTLKRSEGSANIGDAALDAAHNNAGSVYDYYKNVHGRDSYDNAGATLKASAHYSTRYNNAFWNGTQMVYGDGDGSQFIPLSEDLDVDAHELTHAVTERTANLNYANESGALNEATSDILGNSCEAYTENGGTPNANTWKVGEDIYTPGTSGDALRYMNNPTADGYSKDYYPERITGTADNGGVHGNSGIANLAYYLMVMGGTHPRGKTTVSVTPLSTTSSTSLNMAQKIWYRALTVYWTSSTGFSGARTGTVSAATDLYGAAAAATVTAAWDAVGAPGGSTGGGTTVLSNGVAKTGLSGATGSWTNFKITVPSGQSKLDIVMSGGTGDADMYVKFGAIPTSSVWDYRPYKTGNAESVSVANPAAGDWYISLNGYAAYSSVSLTATYSASTSTCTTTSGSLTGTGQNWYSAQYTSSVSGSHTAKLTGPASGADFDLYLQKLSGTTWTQVAASESATATENITYSGTSGTYRWRVYSYSGSGSFTLCTSHP
ncbi:MAG: M4 family metallopeptidase [Acidobacteria bacterium]|nr:M4 family metallopeptidase [Acidobacteriota bacterium]MBV9478948.1 M4 family metallopeptidase [Acidobacteriota bacterium]